MRILKFKRIRIHLIYWFLILSLLPLVVTLTITYFQRVKAIEHTTFEKLKAIRDLKIDRVNYWLNEKSTDQKVISTDKELTDLENQYQKNASDPENDPITNIIRRILNRYLETYSDYYEFSIVNPENGKILISTKANTEGLEFAKKEEIDKCVQTKKPGISDIYYSSSLANYTMDYATPIFSYDSMDEDIIGVLVARINLENSLYKMLLERVGLGNTGETLIVNDKLLAINQLRWYENAPMQLKISAVPAVMAANGKTGLVIAKDYRNVEVVAAYTYIPSMKWGFVAKQDLKELNIPVQEMLWNFIFIFIISAIVIVLVSLRISKYFSNPIFQMSETAKKVQAGDFSARNTIDSDDELGLLAKEFNNMANISDAKIKILRGISAISETMIGRANMKDFGNSLLKRLMKITKANMSTFYILNEETHSYEHFASIGANQEMLSPFNAENAQGEFGNALSTRKIFHLKDIPETTIFKFKTIAGEAIPKEIITIPIKIENIIVAIISLININHFSDESIEIIEQSWATINTSYSNLMAGERSRVLSEHLSMINQELEAQSEELQDQAEELQDQTEELQRNAEELQEQNMELEAQKKQVESANKLKSEFLSNMSHELRTPLNSIMALSRVLITQAKNKLSEEENNYLEIVERNGKRLLTLINSILDLSKIESGKMDILPESVSIANLLQQITENIRTLAEEKGIALTLNIPKNMPLVETDEARLHQVLLNIVSNAVKFTKEGAVSITVKHDTQQVFIAIEDSGIGISKEALPHIFDEFRQADGSSSRQYEGTGLGLAIANKLTQILGGSIRVKSLLGEGSIFTISIPIKWRENQLASNASSMETQTIRSDVKTILVVDDDPKIIHIISKYLNESGYRTISTTSGKEALRLAKEHQPFAITLDVVMPTMDGWEVLQELKNDVLTKTIPVIIVSISNDRDTGFALGAVGYINKPVRKKLLISEIYKLHKSPNTIMIVDDNEFERMQMSEIIEAENMNTLLAKGGTECIEMLKNKIPDILVLDLMMPDVNGFKVLEEIRSKASTKNLPVIIVTAKDLTKDEKEKLSGNIASVISKSEATQMNLLKEIKQIITQLDKRENLNRPKKEDSVTTILIVEDNPDAIIQLKTVLEKEKYKVDIADGGQAALDYLKQNVPSGIILDLMMPDINGFDVLNKIRNTSETKNIPVLILTAKDLTQEDLSTLSSHNIQQLIHKGDIDIDGLLFNIKLMLGEESNLKTSISKEETKKLKSIRKDKESHLPNILVIEDNQDNMTTIHAILKNKFAITEAEDGEQGLVLAQSLIPDLLLLDMSLPGMGGDEVVKQLKENHQTENIPIIAVTAQAMKGDRERILKIGCDGYIPKPIDPVALLNEIGKLLNG